LHSWPDLPLDGKGASKLAELKDTVDGYIDSFDTQTRERLVEFRALAEALFPGVKVTKSYGVIKLYFGEKGYIAYFGGYKDFISMYPVHMVSSQYGDDLKPYMYSKATARFYNNVELPHELITRVLMSLKKDYDVRSEK
jgi:uncharacterized protein YdhG (YjbR/CyaY superfamily)